MPNSMLRIKAIVGKAGVERGGTFLGSGWDDRITLTFDAR